LRFGIYLEFGSWGLGLNQFTGKEADWLTG